jgi:phage tail-like protein
LTTPRNILAGLTSTGARTAIYPTYKFHVEIGSLTEALFIECSGLQMSNDPFSYEEGGLNDFVHKFPGRTKHSNVTLKRGFLLSNEIFDWYLQMEDCLRQGKSLAKECFRTVTINLNSDASANTVKWNLDRAFPVKWSGPTFKTDEAAVAIETLEFAHHGITTQGAPSNAYFDPYAIRS